MKLGSCVAAFARDEGIWLLDWQGQEGRKMEGDLAAWWLLTAIETSLPPAVVASSTSTTWADNDLFNRSFSELQQLELFAIDASGIQIDDIAMERMSVGVLALLRTPTCKCRVCSAIKSIKDENERAGAVVNRVMYDGCVKGKIRLLKWKTTLGKLMATPQIREDIGLDKDKDDKDNNKKGE